MITGRSWLCRSPAVWGDVVTRWDAADAEALAKLQASTPARPASWYGGLEIVRESNGYNFANLTPLYFVSKI